MEKEIELLKTCIRNLECLRDEQYIKQYDKEVYDKQINIYKKRLEKINENI